MSSQTDELLRSIRRWLKAAVFLLGVTLVALSDIGYVVTDYSSGELYATTGAIGSLVALGSVLPLLSGAGNPNPADATNADGGAD